MNRTYRYAQESMDQERQNASQLVIPRTPSSQSNAKPPSHFPGQISQFDYFDFEGTGVEEAGGSSVCVWPSARMIFPWSSCLQIAVPETQGSSRTSAIVARFFGSISSMRPMICLLSLGKRRKRRHGPLITSGFLSGAAAPFDPLAEGASDFGVVGLEELSGIASLAGVSRSVVDLDGISDNRLMSVPGVGADAKSV
jgi:hypothetical protein